MSPSTPVALRGRPLRCARMGAGLLVLLLSTGLRGYAGQETSSALRAEFHVKYVAEGVVYLDRGKNAGLEVGMKLQIKRPRLAVPPAAAKPAASSASNPSPSGPAAAGQSKPAPTHPGLEVIAEVRVLSVALVSAACEVVSSTEEIKVGDGVFLEAADVAKAMDQEKLGATRKYPQIVSFTQGNPLDEEARAFVPRPPMPSINRARGMIGFQYGGLASGGAFPIMTTQLGGFLRADITRIGGTYWNLSGYWRGIKNLQSGAGSFQSIDQLVNRTYHLQLTYNNPNSHFVAGIGRMYLPWAVSLDTIDGGYFGRKLGEHTIVGLFAGTTPDPTSWNYAPNRRMAGSFVNFSGGDFDSFHYSSTAGLGVETRGWQENRQFLFTENNLFFKRWFSVYHSMQVERPRVPNAATKDFTGLARSFLSVRIQPIKRLSFDIDHNYFRDLPTFDQQLILTGLVDQLLFQGFSVGAHLDITKNIQIYNSLGKSSQTGDARGSLNQMYGVTLARLWKTGMRTDFRYSDFNSSFGRGTYESLSLSRSFRETLQWQLLAGKQHMNSTLSQNSSYSSVGSTLDWFPQHTPVYFNFGFTREQGTTINYNQWYLGLGYRFDNLKHHAREVKK